MSKNGYLRFVGAAKDLPRISSITADCPEARGGIRLSESAFIREIRGQIVHHSNAAPISPGSKN
jgi:hypothetical protein